MPIDNQVSPTERQAIGNGLSQLLSDTYVLFLKTHGFYWNVSGPTCSTLGLMFEEHSVELATAVDAIAEQIRALGFPAPGTYSFYARVSSQKASNVVPPDDEMIEQLVQGHDTVARTAGALLSRLTEANDQVTAEWVAQRMHLHEDNARALRALKRSP